MSKFKKVLSIVLCFALLAGSFAFLGDLVVPKAAAADAPTSSVKLYTDLETAYDKFIYVGADAYELELDADGKITKATLTDGKVKAGSWLEYRMYIKSDMWIGANYPIFFYDKRFFDVRNITKMEVATDETYEGNVPTSLYNTNHPVNDEHLLTNTLTASVCADITVYNNGTCELDEADYINADQVKPNISQDVTVNKNAYDMTVDEWLVNWYVRVQDAPTITETTVYSPAKIWRNNPRTLTSGTVQGDTRRTADVYSHLTAGCPTETDAPLATACKSLSTATYYNVVDLHLEDTYKTFTIDDGSGDTGDTEEEKLTVKFVENDGTEISSKDYVVDTAIPEDEIPAAVANQYGWADVDTGVMVDMTTFTVKELADYTVADGVIILKRVLTTDTFPVTVDLNGGSVNEADLPENAEINAGKVIIKAAMGSQLALADILVPERIGYTATWEPANVTVDNLNGVAVKINWTSKNYSVKFYIDKEAAEAGTTTFSEVSVQYGKGLQLDKNLVDESLHKTDADGNVMAFDGWMRVVEVSDTGEILEAERVTTNNWNLGQYTTDADAVYYASWVYSSIAIMVRNLKYTGAEGELEWIEVATKYAEGGSLTVEEIANIVNGLDLKDEFGFGVKLEFFNAGKSGETITSGNLYNNKVDFEKGKKTFVYAYADAIVDVIWKLPVVDAETGKLTDEFTEVISTAKIPATSATAFVYPLTIKSTTTADTGSVPGHTFVKWVDENGEDVMYDARDGITANLAEDALVYTGVFEEIKYTVKFNVGNASSSNSTVKTVEGIFGIGDEINFAEVKILDENGLETELPVAGKENQEQVGGTLEGGKYFNVDGYKFDGWRIGSGVNAREFDPEETIVLTVENIAKYANNTTGEITIRGSWTALEYDLVFKYRTGFDENDQPIYAEALRVTVPTGAALAEYKVQAEAVVKANLPDGTTFGRWSNAAVTKMQAYGMEIYAQYNDELIDVYIDYNTGTEEHPMELADTMTKSAFYNAVYGYDIEIPQFGEKLSLADNIRTGTITRRPCNTIGCDHTECPDNFECIGWKIYYVDAGADPYTADWHEGVNAQGSTIAKTALVFQAQWKAHQDFFFRVYDTNHKICKALGKDFKMYYWSSDIICDRSEANVNHLPEGLVVLFYLVEFENWDWSRFFDIEMWKDLTVKFEAYGINKSFFDPRGFASLMETLINFLIKQIG